MLTLQNFSYGYPEKDLYTNINFTIEPGQHCAFIGVSGSGKSTLTDIIMEPEDIMYEGKLIMDEHHRIGYVSQFTNQETLEGQTVFDYIATPFLVLQETLEAICVEMETATDLDPVLLRYQETLDAYEAIGGDAYESEILKKLHLTGLVKHQHLAVTALSGGEFKLVQIIREMLTKPALLIMDEPDVFLDFGNLNALRLLINSHKGTLLVITHNRYLLTHCFNKILHLENKLLQEFEGHYIAYHFTLLESKVECQELAQADTEEIERNERLIEKLREDATNFADPSRGKALKARVKIQERLEARRIQAPFLAIKSPAIAFHLPETPVEATLLTVTDYEAHYEMPLLEHVNFTINAGEKIALIGANGTGKTTLMRDLFKGTHEALSFAPNLRIGYLSQLQNETLTDHETIREAFLDLGFPNAEAILAYILPYGFESSILDQRIGALSGGERNMLQLAKLGLEPYDLLLLDEPTSHLDTYAQIALEKAIQAYPGAVLMISHDFYTITNCMDYALLIEDFTVRKVRMRKFRQMIYADHFDHDYLSREDQKKDLETRIEQALKANDFTQAKKLLEQLENLIKQF